MTKEKTEPNAKFLLVKAVRSTIGCLAVNARQKNSTPPAIERIVQFDDDALVEPVLLRPLLQHIFGGAEERRHAEQAEPVEIVEQLQVRLVEIDQHVGDERHDDAGHDVDQEQPVPGEQVGQIAADGRADGRRQRRHEADDRRDDRAAFRAERS